MTDQRTYRNGDPREIWDLERLARHRAAKLAIGVRQSQCHSRGRDTATMRGPQQSPFALITRMKTQVVVLLTGRTCNAIKPPRHEHGSNIAGSLTGTSSRRRVQARLPAAQSTAVFT
jgi:hypothetical protein